MNDWKKMVISLGVGLILGASVVFGINSCAGGSDTGVDSYQHAISITTQDTLRTSQSIAESVENLIGTFSEFNETLERLSGTIGDIANDNKRAIELLESGAKGSAELDDTIANSTETIGGIQTNSDEIGDLIRRSGEILRELQTTANVD